MTDSSAASPIATAINPSFKEISGNKIKACFFCDKIFTNTNKIINIPQKYKSKFFEVGSIIKEEIVKYRPINKKNENTKKTIIVLGGSQGAEIFGKIVPLVIKMIKDKGYKIINKWEL